MIHKIPILKKRHEKFINYPSQSFNHCSKLWTRWLSYLKGTTEKYPLWIMARHYVYEKLEIYKDDWYINNIDIITLLWIICVSFNLFIYYSNENDLVQLVIVRQKNSKILRKIFKVSPLNSSNSLLSCHVVKIIANGLRKWKGY